MKKVLLATLVLPLAFSACTNDEFAEVSTPAVDGDLITLSENFALGVTREVGNSRAQWGANGLTWLPELDGNFNPIVNKIGLSWKGQAADGKVYTNYCFESFAWPVSDKTPNIDPCTEKWTNLVFFNVDDFNRMGGEGSDYVNLWSTHADGMQTTFDTNNSTSANVKDAYFKTSNLTIFGGDYLIYSPYDSTMVNSGYLYAKSKAVFKHMHAVTTQSADSLYKHLADEMFFVASNKVDGGTTANGFKLSPVSGIVSLKFTKADNVTKTWENINKIAIYSQDGIVIEQAIDSKDLSLVPNETAAVKKSTSVMIELAESVELGKLAYVALPLLPQTIKNAVVVVFAEDGSSADIEVGDIEVGRGKVQAKEVALTDADALQTEIYYVVDMATFRSAMVKAGTSGKATANIKLLNDIVYYGEYTNNQSNLVQVVNNMTIEGGNIIVPAGEKLTMELSKQGKVTMNGDLIIEDACCGKDSAEVHIYGKHKENNIFTFNGDVTNGGKLSVGANGNTYTAKYIFNKNVINNNNLTIISGTNGSADVEFNIVENTKDINIIRGTNGQGTQAGLIAVDSLLNDGNLNVGEYNKVTIGGELANNGDIDIATSGSGINSTDGTIVIAKDAKSVNNGSINNKGVYDNFGSTTLKKGSEFIDFVGSQWGNTNPVVEEGAEYICEVNTSEKDEGDRLGYALGSKMPTTTVRFVSGSTHQYQLKDYMSSPKLASVKYIINVESTVDFLVKNAATSEITFGTSLVVESAQSVTFNGGKTKVNGDVTVKTGSINNKGANSARVNVAGKLVMDNASSITIEALKDAVAATEFTTPSWVVAKAVELNGTSTLTVKEKAAADFNGALTIAKDAEAIFEYSSYSDIAGTITNAGTLNRELSSGSLKANPAQVWCTEYINNGTQVNGAPQVYVIAE